MAEKMYYSEQEAAEKLGVSPEALQDFVRDEKLRVFQDGGERMFKADEVEALAGGAAAGEEIELTPADTGDQVDLSASDQGEAPAGKDDTVITAEGISIFDDEDLEIETADPMAKTQVTASIDESDGGEGIGSGSGLLDLTRESDNTSLGAVLDNIDVEEGLDEEIPSAEPAGYGQAAPAAAAAPAAPTYVEAPDASAGFFGGMLVGCAILALLIAAIVIVVVRGVYPPFVDFMKEQVPVVLGGSAVLIIVLGVIGLQVGKSTARRKRAMGRMGG